MTIEEKIWDEIVKFHDYLDYEADEEKQQTIENLDWKYTNDVLEVNEEYGLSLQKMEDYEYSTRHFDTGSWFCFEGYFVRFWDKRYP